MSSEALTDLASESPVICLSSTICRQYNPAFPNRVCGNCYPINYMAIMPGVWVCIGFADNVPKEDLFDGWVWIHGRDFCWFGIGSEPMAVWRDAVVLPTMIPNWVLIVPDKLYLKHIPWCFIIQHFLLGWFFPSILGKVNNAWKKLGAWVLYSIPPSRSFVLVSYGSQDLLSPLFLCCSSVIVQGH